MEKDSTPAWYNSYLEYKFINEEKGLKKLIYEKYLPLLGKFIENMYKDLKFDIFVKERNIRERSLDWYGMTYMELKIYDVITSPVYNPNTFEPSYKSLGYNGYINGDIFFRDINSYIPDINKHLAISFVPAVDPFIEKYNMDFHSIPTYECWKEYFRYETTYANKLNCDWGR